MKISEIRNLFEVKSHIAKILATQYYNGWKNSKECNLTREQYFNKSLHNWMDAANGIIHLIIGSIPDDENKEGKIDYTFVHNRGCELISYIQNFLIIVMRFGWVVKL